MSKKKNKPSIVSHAEQWCAGNRRWIILSIITISIIFRVIYFIQLNQTDLVYHHRWEETDMNFFDLFTVR